MERHVNLLGILATLWGALAMLVGVSLLLLSGGAVSELIDPVSAAVELAAGLTTFSQDVSSGQTFYYRVAAFNDTAQSTWSNTAQVPAP